MENQHYRVVLGKPGQWAREEREGLPMPVAEKRWLFVPISDNAQECLRRAMMDYTAESAPFHSGMLFVASIMPEAREEVGFPWAIRYPLDSTAEDRQEFLEFLTQKLIALWIPFLLLKPE